MGLKRRRQEERRNFPLAFALAAAIAPSSIGAFVQRPITTHSGSLFSSIPIERPAVDFLWKDVAQDLVRFPPSAPEWMSLNYHVDETDAAVHLTTTTTTTTDTSETTPEQTIDNMTSSSPHRHRPISSTVKLWKRRLITRHDWKHTHKLTGALFLVSSLGLTGYGIRDLLSHGWTQPVTSHGAPFVTLLGVLLGSSVLQSFSSVSLACHHRQGQPAIRNTFLCNAAVAILGSVSALWSSAWYPTVLNGTPSKVFYLLLDAIGLIGMGDNLMRLQALIRSRQTHKHSVTMSRWQYWKDACIYMMPILIGAPFFVAIGWQFGIRHDRTFYLNILQQQRFPHLQAGAVYGMVMVAMGASYSSLIVTLRDKKLITKRTEGMSLTAIMVCLIGSLYQAMRDPGAIAAIMGL